MLIDYTNFTGLLIGVLTFAIIGIFHPIVIKAEYWFGTKCWLAFLVIGIIAGAVSFFVSNLIISSLLGVFAFTSFWSIKEIFDQEKRVAKGWFPKNPKREKP